MAFVNTNTSLDELINYPRKIIDKLCGVPQIISLLADNPNATIEDIEDSAGRLKYIFDYEYVNDTTEVVATFICVDVLTEIKNSHIADMSIVIHIISHRDHMDIDKKVFKGLQGNRRDNITRFVNEALSGSREFGIGRLELARIVKTSVPAKFTGRSLYYRIPSFNRVR